MQRYLLLALTVLPLLAAGPLFAQPRTANGQVIPSEQLQSVATVLDEMTDVQTNAHTLPLH